MFNLKVEKMKKVISKSEGENYSVLEIGEFENLADYSYLHPKLKRDIPGKLFVGELLSATGVEISFQVLPPQLEIPFLHCHKEHEEVYIFISGKGQFQVDDDLFDIQEGTVVRVAPNGKRTWRNNSNCPMVLIVIQARIRTLEKYFVSDGFGVDGHILR